MENLANVRMSVRQLQALLVVVETKSFTRAAQILHVTQAGLSAMIKELETQLECRLLERSPRSVKLTMAGSNFIPYARQALNSLDQGIMELRALDRRLSGGIRIGVSTLVAETALPKTVQGFTAQYNCSCDIVDAELGEIYDLVREGHLDAAYGMQSHAADGLQSEWMFASEIELICPENFPIERIESAQDWRFLHTTPLLALPKSHETQRLVDNYILEQELPVGSRMEFRHFATVMSFVGSGAGVSFVPSFILKYYSHAPIKTIKLPSHPAAMQYYRTTKVGQAVSDKVAALTAMLAAECRSR